MKKRNLIQKMMAVLLAVLLVMGMAQSGVVSVLARDADSNDIGTTEEGTENKLEADDGTEDGMPAPQANNIASGNDWVLDADGKLTISSDDGMADWENYMRGDYEYYTRQVVNVEIQDGVTSLGNNAFYNYGELTGITIADSVTSIAGSAFSGCWKLRKITIPNNVTSISDRMFMNSGLEEITIPGSVTSIGEFAFWGCGLTKITIPASVQSIGEKAFIYCDNLNEVIIKSETPPTLGDGVFTDCGFVKDNTQSIHVPAGKAQAYKDAWADWAAYIADDTPTPPAEEHKHNDVTFTAWPATDSLPTTAGNYYLTGNVTLSATWNVPGETTLCLNGKTISAAGTGTYRVITIPESCTLNLYDCKDGGNITGGQVGGVLNKGTLHMYGGKISGNGRGTYGGGVWNEGTFIMFGGEISGNSALYFGGGVYIGGGIFRMCGGKISGNTNNMGGGVSIYDGTFTVGGDAVISGNTYNGKENNVYLDNGQMIVLDSETPLSNSANIGVTSQTAPTDGNPVNITGANGADYSSFFTSDNPDYEIVNGENNVVQLALKASPDTQPPTGKIEVATGDLTSASWTEFLAPDQVAFNLFFKDRKWVTIFSVDEGGSGVYGTHYYVSNDALTKAQVEALDADAWTADATVILEPEPDRKCIVYAKITDGAGNVTYLSSDGMVFDATPPVISGVTNGETYNAPQTVTVTDAMSGVKRVTVNGTEVALTGDQFTLGTADGSQTIVAADQAGNTATVTVTVQAQTQSYAVTVRNGTGTGIYRAGDTVTIMANAPASGKQFDKWVVNSGSVTLASATSSTTTFTMPARAVSVTATYKTNTGDGSSTGGGNSSGGGSSTGDGNSSSAGKVEKDVQTDAKAPDTQISTPKAELENMLLTDEEKQQVQNGTDITIVLEVNDAENSVSASDKVAVQQALNGFNVGQYLNIDLYKLAGQTRTDITETAKKIRIVLTVPDSLKNTDSSKTRKFAVIRVHDGRAELLTDLDDSTGTITIETDRFSTYAVVYKDAANGGNDGNNNDDGSDDDNDGTNDNDNSSNNGGNDNGNNNGSNNNGNNNNSNGDNNHNNSDKKDAKSDSQKDDEPKTGDTAPIELYATLAMIAGFAYLLLYFADRERGMTEETKKELVSRIILWAKQGGKIRKCLALAAIFVLLAYYHSIGKKTCAEWKEVGCVKFSMKT